MSYMLFFPSPLMHLSHIWIQRGKNTSWIWLKYQKVTNSKCCFGCFLLVFPLPEKRKDRGSLALLTGLCFFSPAGSHSDQCYCRGYGQWHFLLAGTLKTLPWPLSLFLSVFPSSHRSFSSSFYLLSFFPLSFSKMSSLPLISFSLCLSLSLS